MLKHFLKTVVRNIRRNRLYSLINITGLAVGMAAGLMLVFWALAELSFDRFHKNSPDIFRVIQEKKTDRTYITPSTPSPLAPALEADYPDIEMAVRLSTAGLNFRFGESRDQIFEERGLFADQGLFNMFTYPLIRGNPETALSDPLSMVISERMASACFNGLDAMGKTLTATNGDQFRISGIMRNPPQNSHLDFSYVIPLSYLERKGQSLDRWNMSNARTYVLLKAGADYRITSAALENAVKDQTPEYFSRLILQPLTDIHLRSLEGGGPIVYVRIVLILAVFILIVAMINFINLSTARFRKRRLEVGIRKVVGAGRRQLFLQFFGESIVFSLLGGALALGIVYACLPGFNHYLGKTIAVQTIGTFPVLAAALAVPLVSGIISGIYPAFYLSSFQPVKMFKGFIPSGPGKLNGRRVLVVFQFTISLCLILFTLAVTKQIRFLSTRDMGLDKDNLVFFRLDESSAAELETIKLRLTRDPSISRVTATNAPLLWLGMETSSVDWEGKNTDDSMNVQIRTADPDYLATFRMDMKEGRFFLKDRPADSGGFVLNESAVKTMGLKSPVGKWFALGDKKGPILGVVKDFFHHSAHEAIEPLVLMVDPSWNSYLFIRTAPGQTAAALKALKNLWAMINPNRAYQVRFFDEEVSRLYKTELELSRFIHILSLLAVFISCLGLLGLAAFTAEQKTKEIGIRKVLGASSAQIQILLSRDFLRWVLLANLFAWPLSYYAATVWLRGFAYRDLLGISDFILSGVLVFISAMVTVSAQSFRASTTDPAVSLRYE